MSDYEHERTAPLVSLTAEEAAETMISEGAPLGQPHGAPSRTAWDDAVENLDKRLHEAVTQHPLKSLLIAFGLGLMVGGALNRD